MDLNNDSIWMWEDIMPATYTCGYCGSYVNSSKGMALGYKVRGRIMSDDSYGVYICTNCKLPTFIYEDIQVPGDKFGNSVENVPDSVNNIYEEARNCYAAGAYTGVVLLCRKLLMHISVNLGAKEGQRFVDYVQYLKDNSFITVNSGDWVDAIRKVSNESNHELVQNSKDDAKMLLRFCEMILKTNYEYPALLDND